MYKKCGSNWEIELDNSRSKIKNWIINTQNSLNEARFSYLYNLIDFQILFIIIMVGKRWCSILFVWNDSSIQIQGFKFYHVTSIPKLFQIDLYFMI